MKVRLHWGMLGIALLAGVFAVAAVRVVRRNAVELDPKVVTLRFAHWQLESGVREAFDELTRTYEQLHPNVRVVQMRIPEKVFPQWAMTQLIGGTAPDIIELGYNLETVVQARYFEPISRFVNGPNPYNAGTELEGIPWRSTFVDGLASGYSDKLADYFGIPCFFATIRVYYNRDLMRTITGSDEPPRSFDEFVDLCEQTARYASEHGVGVVPIAGSRDTAPYLLDQVFEGVTQKLAHACNVLPSLYPSQDSFFMAYLAGDWTLEEPSVRAGLELMRDLGRHMSPGFLQLRREDAIFYFSQGKALMVTAGSWEATGLRAQCDFPMGVFRVPLPAVDHPRFGQYTLGAPAEVSGRAVTGPFGISKGSQNPEVALDFLRFISSQRAHQAFVDRSGWLPVVVGVKTPPEMREFEPDLNGALAGVSLRWGTEIKRVTENNWHILFAENGGVDAFIAAAGPDLVEGVKADLRRRDRRSFLELGIADPGLEANRQIVRRRGDAIDQLKYESMLQAQNWRETYYLQMHFRLGQLDAATDADQSRP
jgi:raffinose/stachyose/melibiose transport system substrate-binding protein